MTSLKEKLQRIVIIGNSGSGKSHFARQLSVALDAPVIHFDEHFWEPGGFNKKRPPDVVHAEIKQLSMGDKWIMEGVFGDLASSALENATHLIFLNKTWDECKSALNARGSNSNKQLDPVAAENSFRELLSWAESYVIRENSRSLYGHSKIFSSFHGNKHEFRDRQGTEKFLLDL